MSQPKHTPIKCTPCNTCHSNQIPNDISPSINQQTDYTQFQIESQSSLGNIIENYKMKIIEKDRILFDYSCNLKETEKKMESLRKTNETKDEANQQLKEEYNEVAQKLKQTEALLIQKTEEATQAKSITDQKLFALRKENESVIDKAANMQEIITQQDARIKQLMDENKKQKAEIDKLTSSIDDKSITLVKYEKVFDELKKDNKQMMSLKRQLLDMEAVVSQSKSECNSLRIQNEKMAFDKEDAESRLQQFLSETQREKEKATSIAQLTIDYERVSKLIEEKDKENVALVNKIKSITKDNDSIVHIVSSELGTFTTELESINMATKGIMKIPISTLKPFNSSGLNPTYSLKYEIITKSIQSLKTKIIEIVNEAIILITKLNDNHFNIEKDKQALQFEKDTLLKELTIMKNTNKELAIQIKEKSNSYSALNDSYALLKNTYSKLKTSHSDLVSKMDKLNSEYNEFISQLKSKIDKKLGMKHNETLTRYNSVDSIILPQSSSSLLQSSDANTNASTSIIISQLNNIIEDNYKMNDQLSKLQANEVSSIETIDKLNNEKTEIQSQIDSISQKYQIEINQLTYDKEMELKELKDLLYDKIKSLTDLLEESNGLIQSYEGENKQLKSRNVKLEYNLQMLTQSHIELEKSINSSSSLLQTAYDEREVKYNSILREVELKDIQVKAYEKLLNKDNNSNNSDDNQQLKQIGKIVPNMTTADFVKNEEHEKELHKLMYAYTDEGSEINNTAQNSSQLPPQQEMRIEENNTNTNINDIEGSFNKNIINMNNNNSNTIDIESAVGGGFNIKGKAPGRIYSFKKNK